MLVRDILAGHHGALLEHLTLVVVPLFNPGRQRPHQPGEPQARNREVQRARSDPRRRSARA
jgi:hypothetical protein